MSAPDPFHALADPTRRAILLKVAERPRPVSELARDFAVSRPAVSKHLRVLAASGLVGFVANPTDARQRIVRAELDALAELDDYLTQLRHFWTDKLDRLGQLLTEEDGA